ncbi:MAG: N-acetyltransferase family protein [Archaeoglobaceae archaeon]
MRIRRATEEDEENFLWIYNMAYKDIQEYSYPDDNYVRRYFKWLMDRDPDGVLVAEEEEPLGFIAADANSYQKKEVGHIHELIIRPDAQGKGVGSALLQEGIRYLTSRNKEGVDLWVGATNYKAIEFYKKAEFSPGVVRGRWLRMSKTLNK